MKVVFVVALFIAASAAGSAVQPKLHVTNLDALRNINPRITNGRDAVAGEFPYQVSYQWGFLGFFQHVCGASIISPTWVLTAAHCITEIPAIGSLRIIAGIVNLNENTAQRQVISITNTYVHPSYQGGVNPYDIALAKLASSLSWSTYVQPIRLPAAEALPTGNSILSGWGSTSLTETAVMPNQLQTLEIPVLSQAECRESIDKLLSPGETNPYLDSSNICTGPLTGGLSACSGDSGGPLAQNGQVIGVVSWGFIPCGLVGGASVFTKTSGFIPWINSYVTDLP